MQVTFHGTRGWIATVHDTESKTIRKAIREAYAKAFHPADAVFVTVTGNNGSLEFVKNFRGQWVRFSQI